MVRGHICCGVDRDRLIIRLAPDEVRSSAREASRRPDGHDAAPGITGFALVAPPGIRTAKALASLGAEERCIHEFAP